MSLLRRIDRAMLSAMSPGRLGMVRVLVGLFCVWYMLRRWGVLAKLATMDADGFAPVSIVRVLPSPLVPTAVMATLYVTLALAVVFTLGWRHRIVAPVFAALLLWVTAYRSSWGMIFHSENLLVLHVGILALAPSADAFSLDARRRGAPVEATPDHGWPVRLIWLVTVVVYLLAGIAKLRGAGLDWLGGERLLNHVGHDAVRKAELGANYSSIGAAMLVHPWLFKPLAWFTLAFELLGPVALLHRRASQVWAASVIAFSWGVAITMAIGFFYPMSGIAFAAFFPVERLGDAVARRVQRLQARSRVPIQSSKR